MQVIQRHEYIYAIQPASCLNASYPTSCLNASYPASCLNASYSASCLNADRNHQHDELANNRLPPLCIYMHRCIMLTYTIHAYNSCIHNMRRYLLTGVLHVYALYSTTKPDCTNDIHTCNTRVHTTRLSHDFVGRNRISDVHNSVVRTHFPFSGAVH